MSITSAPFSWLVKATATSPCTSIRFKWWLPNKESSYHHNPMPARSAIPTYMYHPSLQGVNLSDHRFTYICTEGQNTCQLALYWVIKYWDSWFANPGFNPSPHRVHFLVLILWHVGYIFMCSSWSTRVHLVHILDHTGYISLFSTSCRTGPEQIRSLDFALFSNGLHHFD